jgi:hypothetical protein
LGCAEFSCDCPVHPKNKENNKKASLIFILILI